MTATEYKTRREKLGLTQAGLAAVLGVTRKTVNSRETEAVAINEEATLAMDALALRAALVEFVERFEALKWGSDGDCGSAGLVNSLLANLE